MKSMMLTAAASTIGIVLIATPALVTEFGVDPIFDPQVYGTTGQWIASLSALAVIYFLLHEKSGRDRAAEAEQLRAQRSAAQLSYPDAVVITENAYQGPEFYRDELDYVRFRNDRPAPVFDVLISSRSPEATAGLDPGGNPLRVSFPSEPWPILRPDDCLFLNLHLRPGRYAMFQLAIDDCEGTVMDGTDNYFGFEVAYTDELGNRWKRIGDNIRGWNGELPMPLETSKNG